MPNVLDTCWRFQVIPGGPSGTIYYPQNNWYVACAPDSVIMRLTDTELDGLIDDSTRVLIARSAWGNDTVIFTLDSADLVYDAASGDMWYHPVPPFIDAETVWVAIVAAMDTLFNDLERGDSVYFFIDYSPPYITSQVPTENFVSTDIYQDICISLRDDMSGLDPVSLDLSVNGTHYDISSSGITWTVGTGTICLTPEIIGLRWWGADTVDVCIASYDSPDTCGPNAMDSCWEFYIAPGGPNAVAVNPGDSTISACDPEYIEMTISDPHGVDDTTIQVVVYRSDLPDSVIYFVGDAGVNWTEPTLRIVPTAWFADGETIRVCIVRANDDLGNELENPFCWTFFMDLSVFAGWNFAPVQGDTVRTRIPTISATVWDSISGLNWGTLQINVDGNIYDISDTPCVVIDTLSGNIVVDPVACGLMWQGGDRVDMSIWGEDTPTDIRACAPNETTYVWNFFIAPGGPNAQILTPRPGWYSACDPQGIIIKLWDEDGVDSNTIVLVVEGQTYTIGAPELTYDPIESLLVFVPNPNFADDQVVDVALISADDWLANDLETPLSWQFIMDLEAPGIAFTEPVVYMTRNRLQPIAVSLADDGSGIDETSFGMVVQGETFDYGDLEWDITATGAGGEIRGVTAVFNPIANGMEFNGGDTVIAVVSLCDSPDTCGPNCNLDTLIFIVEPQVECLVFPNPFTPNGDGTNDIAVFNYPFMFSETAELAIYTTRNVEVFRTTIDMTTRDIIELIPRCWNGKDMRGVIMPEGLYIYIIVRDGKIICNGTVVLVR